MVHGQQGKVTGPGTGDRKHTHVKVHSPNYTCCAIRCIRCLPIVHTTAVCLSNLKVLFSGNTKSIGCRANDVRRPLAHPSFRPPYHPPTRRSGHEPSGQPPATALLRAGGGGSGEGHSEGRAAGVGGESRRGSLEAEPTAYFHGLGASVSYVYRYESSAGALSARGVCICICAQVSREPPEGSDSEEGALEVALTAASEVVSDSDSV